MRLFGNFISNPFNPIFWQIVFMGLTMFVIIKGVKGGIEKWTKIMMPAILVILFLLMVRGLTLPNGAKPDGWTAFFNSFKYVASDSPILTS